jgi:hypothetical protein
MTLESAFMEIVQLHERTWGLEQYPGRPTLTQLLNSPVIVMWSHELRAAADAARPAAGTPSKFLLTAHKNVEELNDLVLGMILSSRVVADTKRRIFQLYVHQKPVEIRGVQLIVAEKERGDGNKSKR